MKTIRKTSIALAATAIIFTTATSHAQTAYALGNNGTTLIKFDLSTPGITTAVGGFDGAATRLDGIDFRPADGLLYGYSQQDNRVVSINLNNALTTLVSTPLIASTTRDLGIDFNPVADRLRVVNSDDQNLRINISTGVVVNDTGFSIASFINEAAYTNSDTNPGTGTQIYYIDYGSDTLLTSILPNTGPFTTVGALGVDTSNLTGFDILSNGLGTQNDAYAILTASSGIASLYRVNLNTGAASSVGVVSQVAASRPYSLAIQPVPEPGTALFGLALLGASLSRARRKSVRRA